MSAGSLRKSATLAVPQNELNNFLQPQSSEQPSFRGSKLGVPDLAIPHLSIPTFGNIPQSPTRINLPDDPPPAEITKPPSRRPSLYRSETKIETLAIPKGPSAKRPSRTFVRNFSMIYPPAFSDLESKEPDSSPTMLKEYKYRRLDSSQVNETIDDQPNFEANEGPSKTPLSLFGLRTLELQNSNNTSINEGSQASQGNNTSKSVNQSVFSKKNDRRKFHSVGPNPWAGYGTPKAYDTFSAATINTLDSSDEEPMSEHRLNIRRRLKRSFLATYFMGVLFCFKNRVQIYGALRPIEYFEAFEANKPKNNNVKHFPLLPTSTFSVIWMFVLIILMLLNAIITPIYVSFIESDDEVFTIINLVFDVGFGIDIIINFISAYYDSEQNLVRNFRLIAFNYLRMWFWIDIAAILPIDDIIVWVAHDENLSTNNINKLLRLLRIPRLYRMLRILRLVKVVRLFSGSQSFSRILKRLNLNISFMQIFKILINLLFLNHFVGCLWFFIARLDDFNPDTWVARGGLIEKDIGAQYIASLYWVFQTFTTVGYGDIIPITPVEKIICALWPIVSVGVYSFLIGNLGQILSHIDLRSEILTEKISAFERFSSQVRLPDFLRQKVRRFFEINHKENVCHWADPNDMLKDLPANLKTSILIYSYYGLIQNIKLLQVDANFTAALLVHFKLVKLKDEELLYREEDPSHEVYFISKGAIKFVTETAQGIFSVAEGTYFGEMEILEDTKRLCFCQAMGSTVLLVCPKAIFLKILPEFPDIQAQILKISQLRKSKLDERLTDIKRGGDTTERDRVTRITSQDRIHVKTTEYINSVLLKIAAKQGRGDDVDEIGIEMDEDEKKEFLRRKRGEKSNPVSAESLGSITERMKKQSDSRLSLVERLKKLKTKHGDASKKKKSKGKKSATTSKDDFDNELHSGNSPPQSSTSLIKLSQMMVETLPTNPECDTSHIKKDEITGFDLKEPNSDLTMQRMNTASFLVPTTTQMEELNLLGEEKAKESIKDVEETKKNNKPHSIQTSSETLASDSKIISFEKSSGSFFSTNLSSLLKDKTLHKQKFLPRSNKIAPIFVSSRGKESKYIDLKEKPTFHGIENDDSDGSDTSRRINKKSSY